MKVRALKATVEIGQDDVIYIGPFFTRSHDPILRRMRTLLRATYFKATADENPELVERFIASAKTTISECHIYEAYCFASNHPDDSRFFSVSRKARDLPALRNLLGEDSGSGWEHFGDPNEV